MMVVKIGGYLLSDGRSGRNRHAAVGPQHAHPRDERQPLRGLLPHDPPRGPARNRRFVRQFLLRGVEPPLHGRTGRQADVRQRSLCHDHSPRLSSARSGLPNGATTFFRKRLGVDAGEIEREARRELRDTVANFCKEMATYCAHALGCVMRNGVVCTEIGEFLAQLHQRRTAASHGAAAHAARRISADEPHHLRQEGARVSRRLGGRRGSGRCCRSANIPPIPAQGCSTGCCAFPFT